MKNRGEMRILIVGAGIAGLTLGALLKRRGLYPEIIEKAPVWKDIGFSIAIWNNGRRVLEELKVEKEFDKKGYVVPAYYLTDGYGKTIKKYHYEDLKKYYPAMTILARSELHKILRKAVKGISIEHGITINSITQKKDYVQVKFSNKKIKKFDVVIGADGINSQIRNKVFGNTYLHNLGWRGWYFWIDNKYNFPPGIIEMEESKMFFGIFPISKKKITGYLAMPFNPQDKDLIETRVQRFKEHFNKFHKDFPGILNHIDPKETFPTTLAHVHMDSWYKCRIILIGDAAHGMEPFGGIGASMAMEDALVLAEEISQIDKNKLESAFERYEKRRIPRIKIAEYEKNLKWAWCEMDSPILIKIRNKLGKYIPIHYFTSGYEKLLRDPI